MSALSNQIEAGRAYIAIRLDKAALINGLADVGKRMRAFGASVQSFGSDMMRLSLVGAVPVAAAVNSFIKFDDQMRITAAISGATGKQLDLLKKQARDLGSTTAFTAQQIAAGDTALARLGVNANNIQKSLENFMYATRATGNETFRLGEIAEITGNILNQYNLTVEESKHMTDLLSYASNRSAQTYQDVGQAMRSVGGIAHLLGEQTEDTLASLMLLANRGIKGELAGTAMRKAYDGVLSRSKEFMEIMSELGVATETATGELRKPYLIIADIFNAMSKKTNAEKVRISKTIFGLRGMLAGMSIGVSSKEVSSIRQQLNRVHGYAKKTAEEMESGIGGAWRKLVSMTQDLGLEIGESLNTPLSALMDTATDILQQIRDFIKENKALIQSFVVLSAVGATAGAAIMALGLAIKVVAAPFSALAGVLSAFKVTAIVAFNSLLVPVNLAGKAFSTLKTVFTALMKSASLTKYILNGISAGIAVINGAIHVSIGVLTLLNGGIGLLIKSLGAMKSGIILSYYSIKYFIDMMRSFSAALAGGRRILLLYPSTAKLLRRAFDIAKSAFLGLVNATLYLKNSPRMLANLFVSASKGVVAFVKSINLGKIAVIAYQKVVVALKGAKTSLLSVLKSAGTSIISFIRSLSIAKVYNAIVNGLTKATHGLSSAIKVLKGGFVSMGNSAKMALAAGLKPILIAIAAVGALAAAIYGVSKAYPKVQEVASSTLGKMKGWWNENKSAIIDFGKTLYQAIQIGDIAGAFKLAFAGVVKVIGSAAPTIVSALSKITIPVMNVWYSMCQYLEESLMSTMEFLERQWLTVTTLTTKFRMPTEDEYKSISDTYERGRQGVQAEYDKKRGALQGKADEYMSSAVSFQQRANAEYIKAMRDVKGVPEMQKAVANLNALMQNAAADYRDNVLLGMYEGFKGSRDDAYTTIGKGNMNAMDAATQKTRLQTRIKEYAQYADKLEETFGKQLKMAQMDSVITEKETEALQKLIDERGYALYMEEELRNRLQAIGETTGEKIQESSDEKMGKPSSAYSVRMLNLTNGFDSPDKRTAKATESLDKNVKWLRDYIAPIVGTVIA